MGNAFTTNWDETARAHAVLLQRESADRPRAVVRLGRDVSVVFGNDGFASDGRVRLEVTLLRRQLRSAALTELGFGLSHDRRSWAVVVRTDDVDALRAALDTAYQVAFATNG